MNRFFVAALSCIALLLSSCEGPDIHLEQQIPAHAIGPRLRGTVGVYTEAQKQDYPAQTSVDRSDQGLPPLANGIVNIRFDESLAKSIAGSSRLIFDNVLEFDEQPANSEMADKAIKVLFVSRVQNFSAEVTTKSMNGMKVNAASTKLDLSTLALGPLGDTIATFLTTSHGEANLSEPRTKAEALREAGEMALQKVADKFMEALLNSNRLKLALMRK